MAGFLVGESKFRLGRDYGLCLAIECGMLFASFLFLRSEYVLGEWVIDKCTVRDLDIIIYYY